MRNVHAAPAPLLFKVDDDPKQALCSNDLVIKEFEDGTLEFDANHTVKKTRRRELVFSNGVTSYFDSFGWLQFSNGYAVRRLVGDIFKMAQPRGRELLCQGGAGRIAAEVGIRDLVGQGAAGVEDREDHVVRRAGMLDPGKDVAQGW